MHAMRHLVSSFLVRTVCWPPATDAATAAAAAAAAAAAWRCLRGCEIVTIEGLAPLPPTDPPTVLQARTNTKPSAPASAPRARTPMMRTAPASASLVTTLYSSLRERFGQMCRAPIDAKVQPRTGLLYE